MIATVSLCKLGQDRVLSGPCLCRELGWISDLQGCNVGCGRSLWPCQAQGAGEWAEWPLSDTAASSGRAPPRFIFPAQPCVPTDPGKCSWSCSWLYPVPTNLPQGE